MAMGIVSDKDFNKEKDGLSPSVPIVDNGAKIKIVERGRGTNNVEVPSSLRKVIGEESITNGRASAMELSKQFGIGGSSVSAYTKGSTSTKSYNEPNNELSNHISGVKTKITNRAVKKLNLALNSLTQEKLDESKARDISSVARDMSAIIKNMEPEKESKSNDGHSGPTFVFYQPPPVKEETFDVIYSKE